ncbi:MAG: DUF6718 family protein [Romboutsia sp.]
MNISKEELNKKVYIIAKDFNKVGSLVLKIEKDNKIKALIMYLLQESLDTNIEIVETNNIESFKEYYPIKIIKDTKEFTIKVLNMMKLKYVKIIKI